MTRVFILGALVGLLAAPAADAACCYFSAKNADILQPAQKVFITWDPAAKSETFTVQPKFEGNALDFGMVIPTPSQPKLHEMPRDFFKHLAVYSILKKRVHGEVLEEIARHLVQLRLARRRDHHAEIESVALEFRLHGKGFALRRRVPGDEDFLGRLENVGVLGGEVAARGVRRRRRQQSDQRSQNEYPSHGLVLSNDEIPLLP